ncbi:MAG: hypothetical protein LAT67_11410 [Balneolales bacterium]|nr:hypothetical protein [Balneolales bacterium]
MDLLIVFTFALIVAVLLFVFGMVFLKKWKNELAEFGAEIKRKDKTENHEKQLVELGNKLDIIINYYPDGLSTDTQQSDAEKLAAEDEKLQHWREMIAKPGNDVNRLEFTEAAAIRFPSERKFIEEIRQILHPLAKESDNLLIRREALIRLRNHANRFYEHCFLKDFEYASRFKREVLESMEAVVKKIDELRKLNIEKQLKEMEMKINRLKYGAKSAELTEEIEKADQKIDHSVLDNYPGLKQKYEELSQVLMTILSKNESEGKEELKKYNQEVLDKAKKAVELMKHHSEGGIIDKITSREKDVNYNEEKNLIKVLRLIAGHDMAKLHPSVVNYLRVAEAEVFNKLSPDGKILFTELMIKEAYK